MPPKRSLTDPDSSFELAPSPEPSHESDSSAGDKDVFDSTPTPASDGPSRVADASIKPIKSRPMDSISAKPVAPSRRSVSQPRSKRTKTVANLGRSSKRIWSKQDEIVLVNGLVDYKAKNGGVPGSSKEIEAFRGFIKGSLSIEVSNTQISDKIRSLKRKFNNQTISDPSFSDIHEQTLFSLSKTLWGSNETPLDPPPNIPNPLISDSDSDKETTNNFLPLNTNKSEKVIYPYFKEMVDFIISKEVYNGVYMKRALMGLDESKALEMEKKIRKFRRDEIELGLRRIELVKESVRVLLDGVKKSE